MDADIICGEVTSLSPFAIFEPEFQPPPAPELKKPKDGSSTHKLKFQWKKVKGAVEYQIQVDNNADFSSPEIDATSLKNKYKPATMPFGDFYWRVRARDGAGVWGEWSNYCCCNC